MSIKRKAYSSLTQEQIQSMDEIEELGVAFYTKLNEFEPSRYNSLAMTAIEEAIMWATKGITRS